MVQLNYFFESNQVWQFMIPRFNWPNEVLTTIFTLQWVKCPHNSSKPLDQTIRAQSQRWDLHTTQKTYENYHFAEIFKSSLSVFSKLKSRNSNLKSLPEEEKRVAFMNRNQNHFVLIQSKLCPVKRIEFIWPSNFALFKFFRQSGWMEFSWNEQSGHSEVFSREWRS